MRSILTSLLFLALAGPALAVDGVVEINQTCAVQTGCFSGDAAGFPVVINGSAGHSYVLTGDLTIPDENTTAIQVTVDSIRIDLGGHRIKGPVSCYSSPVFCSVSGDGVGIDSVGFSSGNELVVANGTIQGMGGLGIEGGSRSRVERVTLRANAGGAVKLGTGSQLTDSIAVLNDSLRAFDLGDNSLVRGNTSINNGGVGITVGGGSVIVHNTVVSNDSQGVFTEGPGCTITGNAVNKNRANGIFASGGSALISGNTAHDNFATGISASGGTVIDNHAGSNGLHGISVGSDSTVQRNVMRDNGQGASGGYGLKVTTGDSTYGDNLIVGNADGGVNGTWINLGGNYCAGPSVVLSSCP